ncbi:MAG TPA: hypothetical protein VNH63_08825 [Gemmatimonadales bacterium]|nr:hypothetical protein [Gemmatimonadales bacterium]
MKITHIASALVALSIGAATSAMAQRAAKTSTQHAQMGRSSHASSTPTATKTTFRGIAAKLGTTPDALETAYTAAKQANPKLTRGQFVAANVLAKNLGDKNSAITTQAILDGLQSGKSIGQTLQGLGMGAGDADKAQDAANKEIRAASRARPANSTKDSTKSN